MGTEYTMMLWQDGWGAIASIDHDKEVGLGSLQCWRWLPYDERPQDSIGRIPGDCAHLAVCDRPADLLAALNRAVDEEPSQIRFPRQWRLARALVASAIEADGEAPTLRVLLEACP